jgi:hypothetical protein
MNPIRPRSIERADSPGSTTCAFFFVAPAHGPIYSGAGAPGSDLFWIFDPRSRSGTSFGLEEKEKENQGFCIWMSDQSLSSTGMGIEDKLSILDFRLKKKTLNSREGR